MRAANRGCPRHRNIQSCLTPVPLDRRIPDIALEDPEQGEDQSDNQEGDYEYAKDGDLLDNSTEVTEAAVGIIVAVGVDGGVRIDHAGVGLTFVVAAQASGSARRHAEQAQEWTE